MDEPENIEPQGLLAEPVHPRPILDGNSYRRKGTEAQLDRALGAVVGSAVGDALGAPFEFGPVGAFTERFPNPGGVDGNEMVGGGRFGWGPGEFTDDTQMAILEGLSFVACNGIDEHDLFARFVEWMGTSPRGVGGLTRSVLTDDSGWPDAVKDYCVRRPDRCSGNGSVMRASFAAARWAFANSMGTAEVARRLSVVTHGDPSACEGRAVYHLLVQSAVREGAVAEYQRFDGVDVHVVDWWVLPNLRQAQVGDYRLALAGEGDWPNGTAWGCLRDAYRAVVGSEDFEGCMRLACDVGGDVDTVAAVAGGIAGGLYGLSGIPSRWVDALNGTLLGEQYGARELSDLLFDVMMFKEPRGWAVGHQLDNTDVRYGAAEYRRDRA